MTARIHPLRPKRDQRAEFDKLHRRWEKEKFTQDPPARIPGWGAIGASLILWGILIGLAAIVAWAGWTWTHG